MHLLAAVSHERVGHSTSTTSPVNGSRHYCVAIHHMMPEASFHPAVQVVVLVLAGRRLHCARSVLDCPWRIGVMHIQMHICMSRDFSVAPTPIIIMLSSIFTSACFNAPSGRTNRRSRISSKAISRKRDHFFRIAADQIGADRRVRNRLLLVHMIRLCQKFCGVGSSMDRSILVSAANVGIGIMAVLIMERSRYMACT